MSSNEPAADRSPVQSWVFAALTEVVHLQEQAFGGRLEGLDAAQFREIGRLLDELPAGDRGEAVVELLRVAAAFLREWAPHMDQDPFELLQSLSLNWELGRWVRWWPLPEA